jgi:GT2 family glycosyltransferase
VNEKPNVALSIIIVSYNTCDVLRDCLNSLKQHVQYLSYEVIVVDNASRDTSVAMLKNEFPDAVVITNPDNRGFSKANNQGMRQARGRYVLLLNSDTLVFDNGFKRIADYMDQNPGVGVLGCKVLNRDRSLQYSCWHQPTVMTEWMFFTKAIIKDIADPWTDWKLMKSWDRNSIREVDCLSGCFLWIRREVLDQSGLLDENFFMYYEDFEFCHRVRARANYKVVFYSDAAIVHLGQASANTENFSLVRSCYESVGKYFRKCGWHFSWCALQALCVVTWHLEMLVFALLSFHPKARRKLKMLLILSGYVKN